MLGCRVKHRRGAGRVRRFRDADNRACSYDHGRLSSDRADLRSEVPSRRDRSSGRCLQHDGTVGRREDNGSVGADDRSGGRACRRATRRDRGHAPCRAHQPAASPNRCRGDGDVDAILQPADTSRGALSRWRRCEAQLPACVCSLCPPPRRCAGLWDAFVAWFSHMDDESSAPVAAIAEPLGRAPPWTMLTLAQLSILRL